MDYKSSPDTERKGEIMVRKSYLPPDIDVVHFDEIVCGNNNTLQASLVVQNVDDGIGIVKFSGDATQINAHAAAFTNVLKFEE